MKLLSKELPLHKTIDKLNTILDKLNIEVEIKEYKNPLPNCYWVNLAFSGAPTLIYSNGKGTSKEAAIASALGEFFERLITKNYFYDFYLPNRELFKDIVYFDLDDYYLDIYNLKEIEPIDLIDFNSDNYEKIATIPFKSEFSNKIHYIPINILENLFVSNGLAAGNTLLEAKVQALSEIIERYVKFEVIKCGYSLPEYPDEILKKYKSFYSDLKTLKDSGFDIKVLDASFGGRYPVTAIALIDKSSGGVFVSFGAHPNLQVSLERTLTELMQGREIDSLKNFSKPTFDKQEVISELNLESHFIDSNGLISFEFFNKVKSFEFVGFNFNGSRVEEYNYLLNILNSQNKDVLVREYSFDGFYACSIIVPNFSEVYPIEDLIYSNKNRGKFLRDKILNISQYSVNEILQELENLSDNLDIGQYIGVKFKENFTVASLKVALYILNRDYENALWYLDSNSKKLHQLITELIKAKMQNININEYRDILETIYSKSLLERALNIDEGEEFLINLEFDKSYQNILFLLDKIY